MSRSKLVLLVSIFVIEWSVSWTVGGSKSIRELPIDKFQSCLLAERWTIEKSKIEIQKSKIATQSDDWLVWPELLSNSKLKMLWQKKLPLKETEKLQQLFILGNRIYALSDENFLVSLDRENGNIIFSRSIAPAGFPIVGLELYDDELFSIVGNRLVEINPVTGIEHSGERLKFGITCRPARNSSYFYVAGADGRMRALRAEDKIKLFEVTANDNSRITSIVANERFVVFASDKGTCISITPDGPKQLWRFNAGDCIASPIVRCTNSLFFASKDTNVYRIDIASGKLIWKFQTAGILQKGPRVTGKVVYQYVHNKGLWAIDKESGKFMWQLAEGIDLLAEASGRAYVIANGQAAARRVPNRPAIHLAGKLVVMDNESCKQLYSVNFARVSKYATNLVDSKIYVADEAGWIACIKPMAKIKN